MLHRRTNVLKDVDKLPYMWYDDNRHIAYKKVICPYCF